MSGKKILDRFVESSPLAVMTRAVVGEIVDERFDDLFEDNRSRQYDGDIKFSILALSMADITLGMVENRNQAYRKYQDQLQASKTAYYGKLNRLEPALSEAVVGYSGERAGSLFGPLGYRPSPVLPGYRCFLLDGNHLQKTEKRLKETRCLCTAPLPGTIVARFDLDRSLFDRAYVLEDAHAQESAVLDRVVEDMREKDVVIADRHFCIVRFLLSVASRCGYFVIRQHGRLKGKLLGRRRRIGRTETGEVFEQKMLIQEGESRLIVRRITVCLNKATRDGDMEIHLLSNVAKKAANARTLAELYRQRWEIENAFHVLTMTLKCEMASNCYPRAALFQFCMAMVAYNGRQVLFAALHAEHDAQEVESMSQYQMALDIEKPMQGLRTAITDEQWARLVPRSPDGLAKFLRHVSRYVDVKSYRKSVRGPKKKKPPRKRCTAGSHVSTAKLLKQRKQRC